MTRRKKKETEKDSKIMEEFRIATEKEIYKFLQSDAINFSFTNQLTKTQRAFIHNFAKKLRLGSKSSGNPPNRVISVFKRGLTVRPSTLSLKLSCNTIKTIDNCVSKFNSSLKSVNKKEPEDISYIRNNVKCRLGKIKPMIPQKVLNSRLIHVRKSLPIWSYQHEIIDTINKHQVVIITGETGSGKTTQVPQFILDNASVSRQPCRIICTEPRRLSAIAVAERVANERGEKIGQTVGYQVRLESEIGDKTLLTYCTNGVLLRSLMKGSNIFTSITHVIVDEVHERDKYTDFLLICLRECIKTHKHLKVMLMSATINTNLFVEYLSGPPVISIPGRQFPVEEYFLENILSILNYVMPERNKLSENKLDRSKDLNIMQTETEVKISINVQQDLHPDLKIQADECLLECWLQGTDDSFLQLIHFFLSDNVPVNYQHSDTGVTVLMAACVHNNCDIIERLLNLGPDLNVQSSNNMTALNWAEKQGHMKAIEMLTLYQENMNLISDTITNTVQNDTIKTKEQELLYQYHNSISSAQLEHIDFKLAVELIIHIHTTMPEGSILFFVAGYDDIIAMKELITMDRRMIESSYIIFALHSSIETWVQRQIFSPVNDKRKIIISTNIAETSITIDDVVYVIDSGKVKEKSFDATSGMCMLRSEWISRSCASQRAGRAGRIKPGICYRLFSQLRFNSMQLFSTPEILRSPIHELCLHTKIFAPVNSSIANFLSNALEPPSPMIISTAVQSLKTMEALDENEELTTLGSRLLELPIEPCLAKMILNSIVFHCLDPVLTIACCLSSKDPFVLPFFPSQKQYAATSRQNLSSGTFSDHMIFLRAFQEWQYLQGQARRKYCEQNYLNSATLEMISATRDQILSQLHRSNFIKGSVSSMNVNSDKWYVVKAALAGGLYPNVAMMIHRNLMTARERKVDFHSSSTLRNIVKEIHSNSKKPDNNDIIPEWFIYDEITRAGGTRCLIRGVTGITPMTVFLTANTVVRNENDEEDSEDETEETDVTITVDNWITFKVDCTVVEKLIQFHTLWKSFMNRNIGVQIQTKTIEDKEMLKTLIAVLNHEEFEGRFQQPADLQFKPKIQSQAKSQLARYHRPTNFQFKPQVQTQTRSQPVPKGNFHHRSKKINNKSLYENVLYSDDMNRFYK